MSAFVLAACGEEKAPSWKGEWKNTGGEKSVCRKSFTFKGENNIEIQNSRVQGGEQSSGTYKHIESNDYEFDYGGGSDNFTIIIEKNTMKVHSSGKDTIANILKSIKFSMKIHGSKNCRLVYVTKGAG